MKWELPINLLIASYQMGPNGTEKRFTNISELHSETSLSFNLNGERQISYFSSKIASWNFEREKSETINTQKGM